eukprot:1867891-Alexandrium_andersonii.AAC.1
MSVGCVATESRATRPLAPPPTVWPTHGAAAFVRPLRSAPPSPLPRPPSPALPGASIACLPTMPSSLLPAGSHT